MGGVRINFQKFGSYIIVLRELIPSRKDGNNGNKQDKIQQGFKGYLVEMFTKWVTFECQLWVMRSAQYKMTC